MSNALVKQTGFMEPDTMKNAKGNRLFRKIQKPWIHVT